MDADSVIILTLKFELLSVSDSHQQGC